MKHIVVYKLNFLQFCGDQDKEQKMNTTVTQQEIGKRIAALRKRKALSQEDLAKLLNISAALAYSDRIGKQKPGCF